jgi:hypothetical protein
MMEPGNALVWTNPQTLPEKVDQIRAPSISEAKARQTKAERFERLSD